MEYFIAIAVIITAVVIYGALSRRKIYRRIDTLETWKIDIMNRPVTEEISRLKRLRMDGQTEMKFETWRKEWDDIITVELPEAEERLFQAEDAADKYRFRKAMAILDSIHTLLENTEVRIKGILDDLDRLISSEQRNREDIVSVKDAYHEMKKHLLTHRRHYQKAIIPIENEIKVIEDQFQTYEEETNEGNYLEARKVLTAIKEQIEVLQGKMEVIPCLFTEFQSTVPDQLKELTDGYEEMQEQGYKLDHLAIKEEVEELGKQSKSMLSLLEKAEVEKPEQQLNDIRSRIEALYDLLEKEALSKQTVLEEHQQMKEKLDSTEQELTGLKRETETVQQSYRIDEEDLEMQEELEKEFRQISKKFYEADEAINSEEQAYSLLQDKLSMLKERLNELENAEKHYKEMLHTLRKDELKAKETIGTLRKKLLDAKRLIQKNNLPGLPEYHLTGIEAAHEKTLEVEDKLEEKPLEMSMVNRILEEALQEVNQSYDLTEKLVENALLAEQLIQYGNRYRSRYRSVDHALSQAEAAFRDYHYEEAMEVAARAIEEVEPGVLERFQVKVKENA